MWGLASNATAGGTGQRQQCSNSMRANPECSDDEGSSCASRKEGLECPICYESFNMVENVPYVLWCGHTLCKNCVLGLQSAVVKFPTLPIQLPLFISCPWCNLLSFRLVYNGDLKFPRKNFFLLRMVESMNGNRGELHSSPCFDRNQIWPSNSGLTSGSSSSYHDNHNFRRSSQYIHAEQFPTNLGDTSITINFLTTERIHSLFQKSLACFVHLTAKFPLVLIFLITITYAIPASAIVLVLYILVTILFALPSFLILYFAYPSLDWLVREIVT